MIKKYLRNRMFWVGVNAAWLLDTFLDFINGNKNLQTTAIYGTIFILCMALEISRLNKQEEL